MPRALFRPKAEAGRKGLGLPVNPNLSPVTRDRIGATCRPTLRRSLMPERGKRALRNRGTSRRLRFDPENQIRVC
jgi:hypothetical protein